MKKTLSLIAAISFLFVLAPTLSLAQESAEITPQWLKGAWTGGWPNPVVAGNDTVEINFDTNGKFAGQLNSQRGGLIYLLFATYSISNEEIVLSGMYRSDHKAVDGKDFKAALRRDGNALTGKWFGVTSTQNLTLHKKN